MNIIDALIRLRDDLKEWVTNNINVLQDTIPSTDDFATREYVNEKLEDVDLTTSIKINGEIYTQDNGTIELPDMRGNCKAAYGTCSTEASVSEKAVVVDDDWKLEIGNIITVRFSVANTASNVTLNVNGTGAYGIRTSGESAYTGNSSTYCGNANRALTYMFDGSHWQWISAGAYPSSATNVSLGQGYTTCSTAAATKAKTASLSSYILSTGGIVVIKFTNDVPDGATLNVNSKGAKAIYYKGAAITDGVIKAGDTATFIYSTRYHLISIDRETPTKTSQLTNDSDFITKHQGSENAGKILAVDNNGDIVFEEMPEGSGEGGTKSESLEFAYTTTYPNQTTFAYSTSTSQTGNWIYKKSTLLGGILSVDWNTSLLTSVELILYLFDSDGNPYRYTQRYQSSGMNENIAGDKYNVVWMEPGTSSGFCIAKGPFTIKIPDDCSVMVAMRGINAVFPSGSTLNNDNFYKLASSVFSVSVIKETSVAFAKVDVVQGANNANRIMITNDKGEVVVGDINPNSMALRPNWDTVIHRGWLNGAKENTIPAFYLAKENGYSWVECDIRISSDGVPVLAHDATITSEDGASVLTVAESTVSQLQSITLQNHERFGAIKMNTLAELLDMARCLGMKIVLDIKVSGESAMKSIAKTVLRYGMSDNVIYMPIGTTNASYIKMIDKNASFDFVMYGTDPTSTTDLTGYASLLNGSNHVNLDIQANTWEFTPTVIDAINNVGLGLCAWNVTNENIGKCIDSGMLRITKHNNFDDVDLNTDYLKDKKFW